MHGMAGHIRTRVRTYVLARAYALRAVRQHRARPYRIALLALTLPHSNAEEELVFSLVTKNKTKFRPNLKLDGTLSSILTIKLANTSSGSRGGGGGGGGGHGGPMPPPPPPPSGLSPRETRRFATHLAHVAIF